MVEKERLNSYYSPPNSVKNMPLNKPVIPEDIKIESMDRQNSETHGSDVTPSEVDKFNTLCDGVLSSHSMFDICLTEMLAIKDELLKYSLPSNLLINLTLSCSKLYRSASDLAVPTNELVRLVRLYSAQWEAKSNVLKKLHEDYESKQRRLEIALKKLELVGVASERIEKEKRIMNWEKIFSKVMSAKSHGHRWKFLIKSLKEKVQSGEILSIPFPSNSTDEETNGDKTEPFVRRHHRRSVKSLRHQSLLRREARNSRTRNSEEAQSNEGESELSSEEDHLQKHDQRRRRKLSNDRETKINITSSRFKSKYPFERDELPRRFKAERVESPTGIRSPNNPRSTAVGRRFIPIRNDGKKNVSFFDETSEDLKPIVPTKEEKSVWTGEIQYDRFLHVRVYKPECKKVPKSVCTVCFGDQVCSSGVFGIDEDTSETLAEQKENDKKLSKVPPENSFQEFVLTLPEGPIYEKGKPVWSIESQQLRVAVQPGKGKPMAAMCTIEYSNLDIPEKDSEKDDLSDLKPVNHPLLSLMSDKETVFNSEIGHIPLIFYQTKKERLLSLNQSTQTSSIQELFEEMLEVKRIEEEEKEKLKEKEPEKMYTEIDFEELKKKHDEEMDFLRKDYEYQLQEIFRATNRSSPATLSPCQPKFVNVSTSPIPRTSPSPFCPKTPQRPRTAEPRYSPRKGKKIKTTQVLPEWGKDLPANFFDRLEQFSQASAKHHKELAERTKKAVQENYELQMATQNRLNLTDDEIDLNDVCLPALFMPSRMGTVYSPKASLYFHPSGISRSRFTQPPSVFKLPFVAERDHSSVINLFDLSQSFLQNGPTWLSDDTRPRSASPTQKSISTVKAQEASRKLKSE